MQDAVQTIITRNLFYKRLHYYAVGVLFIALIVIGIMTAMLLYISRHSHEPLYFATDNVGRLIRIVPVTQPNMSDDDVLAWSVEAVQTAYSYDYVNYHEQLQSAQKYFTAFGWSQYMDALRASNNLIAVEKRRLVAVATVVDKPTIIKEGSIGQGGPYAWRIQMPVLVTYYVPPYDDASKYNNSIVITVVIRRQSILESYKGLGIVQLIGAIATAPVNTVPAPVSTTPT